MKGGGAERVVQTIANYLVGKTNDLKIIVVTMDPGYVAYDMDSKIKTYNLKLGFLNRSIGKILFLPFQAWEFARIVQRERPNAVISFLVRANLVHVLSRVFGNKNQIIISERTTTYDLYKKANIQDKIMGKLIRLLYPKADCILAISKGVKKSLEFLGINSKKIRVIHNPQDIDRIKKQSSESCPIKLNVNNPVIVTTGRLVDQKDHVTLLEAFVKVNRKTGATLVVIGDGPKRDQLERKAKTLGIFNSVIFAGWQSNPFSIMKMSDLFVLSSKIEGFGNVIVEAMACGLPIVSTNLEGPREILKDGEVGLLVPVGDSKTLGDAILTMLTDKELYSYYKGKSFERAEEFDVKKIIPQYLNFLDMDFPIRTK